MDLDTFLPAILARDTHAFGRWMAGAEGPIRDSLRSFATVVDVEAVLQEALLRVWQVAPRFVQDGRPNGLLRLGVRIARNLAISEVRRTKSRPTAEDDLERRLAEDQPSDAEGEAPDPMLRGVIANCYERLPGKPKEALRARLDGAGSDDATLAASLHMRINTFLQNFGRARKLLAECLRKHGVVIDEELAS
jgi:DNA-directed RNA polymerase specialized sigma24 family protein